jgi:hypothetical protein
MKSQLRIFFATPVFAISIVLYKIHLWFDHLGCIFLGLSAEDASTLIREAYGAKEEEDEG